MISRRAIDEGELSYISGVLYLTAALAVVATLTTLGSGGLHVDAMMLVGFLPSFLKKGSKVAWILSILVTGLFVIEGCLSVFSRDTSFTFGALVFTTHWSVVAAVYFGMLVVWLPCLYWLVFRRIGPPLRAGKEPIQPSETTRGK